MDIYTGSKWTRQNGQRAWLLVAVAYGLLMAMVTCSPLSADPTKQNDLFSDIRKSGLDIPSWIYLGMQAGSNETQSESEICLGSNVMRLLLHLLVQGTEDKAKEAEKISLLTLTDEELEFLCSLLCGMGTCPPGCPENTNPCPWGCPDPDDPGLKLSTESNL